MPSAQKDIGLFNTFCVIINIPISCFMITAFILREKPSSLIMHEGFPLTLCTAYER